MLKKSIVNFCPNEYSGDEVEVDSFESRLFHQDAFIIIIIIVIVIIILQPESRIKVCRLSRSS